MALLVSKHFHFKAKAKKSFWKGLLDLRASGVLSLSHHSLSSPLSHLPLTPQLQFQGFFAFYLLCQQACPCFKYTPTRGPFHLLFYLEHFPTTFPLDLLSCSFFVCSDVTLSSGDRPLSGRPGWPPNIK